VTDSSQKDRIGPLGIAGLTEETPSTQVLARYLPEKVSMSFQRTGSGEQTYLLIDGSSIITENEFIRRYRSLTGRREIDYAEVRRNYGTVITFGILTAAAAYGTYWGAKNASGKDENGALGIMALSMFGTAGLLTGGSFIYFLFDKDGAPTDHSLSANQITPRIAQYNKALLHKTMREVEGVQNASSLWLLPNIGLQSTGLSLGGNF
jgi:hypothetical protein